MIEVQPDGRVRFWGIVPEMGGRVAVLLLGGNKGGNDRWYEENVLKADKLYDELLEEIKKDE